MSVSPKPLTDEDLDRFEELLDGLRERHGDAPQLEQIDGFITALICGPRAVGPDEYLPKLMGEPLPFADAAEKDAFMALLLQRWNEVKRALDAPVERLDDDRALNPLLTDWEAMREQLSEETLAGMSAEERAALDELPPLGAVWASGFLDAVDQWEDDWLLSAEDPGNDFVDGSLRAFEALAAADEDLAPEEREMSRDERLADALWAVYDLRDFWRERASRKPVKQAKRDSKPGPNEPCSCGSGKKFKKCCGDPAKQVH